MPSADCDKTTIQEKNNQIMAIIADVYSTNIKTKSVNNLTTMKQYQSIYCGTTKECVDCQKLGTSANQCKKECENNSCQSCIENYINLSNLDDEGIFEKMPYIEKIRDGICNPVCACDIDVAMSDVVLFASKTQISFSVQDKQDIIEKIKNKITQKSCSDFVPSVKDLQQIINDNKITNKISTTVYNVLSNSQSFTFQGTGTIQHITMSMMTNAILQTLISNETARNVVDDIVNNSMQYIKTAVDSRFTSIFQSVWAQSKVYFITTFAIVGFLIFIMVFMLITRSFRSRPV